MDALKEDGALSPQETDEDSDDEAAATAAPAVAAPAAATSAAAVETLAAMGGKGRGAATGRSAARGRGAAAAGQAEPGKRAREEDVGGGVVGPGRPSPRNRGRG